MTFTASQLQLRRDLAAGADLAAGSLELLARRRGFTVRIYPDRTAAAYWTGTGPHRRRPLDRRALPVHVDTLPGMTATLDAGSR